MGAEMDNKGKLVLSGIENEWWETFSDWFSERYGRRPSVDAEVIPYLLAAMVLAKGEFEHNSDPAGIAAVDATVALGANGSFTVNTPAALSTLALRITAARRSEWKPTLLGIVADMSMSS
jgi:hypothetical protein